MVKLSRPLDLLVVAAFPLALIAGTWVGQGFRHLDFIRPVSLVTMSVLGLLFVAGRRLPLRAMTTAALGVGLLLGYRSGVDMTNAGVGLQFIPGVRLTGGIMATLGSACILSTPPSPNDVGLRLAEGSLAVAGIYMLAGVMAEGSPIPVRTIGLPTEERLMALVTTDALTFPMILGACLAATGWGTAHALTPGHGKAIVGAYLVGSRGTTGHALYLGLTVTATHTIGVFALGLIALVGSRRALAEQLFPWLAAASGVIVIALGVPMLVKRARPLFHPHVPHRRTHRVGHHRDPHHNHTAIAIRTIMAITTAIPICCQGRMAPW